MKTNLYRFRPIMAALAAVIALALTVSAAPSNVTAQLEPSEIALGESAQLVVTVTGSGDDVAPPSVPGLDFAAVGQSSQFQSINGVESSSTTLTYEVTAQHAGKFTIPAMGPGAKALVLNVRPGNARGNPSAHGNSGAQNLPPPATSGLSSGATHLSQDGSAFARLRLPKRELYVGETVPVEIQVGVRSGTVVSLNGLPTLNGDAFTLNKLSSKPEQEEKAIGGKPFTLLTWHSVLAAIKPGEYSLTVETPLTVRVRTTAQRRPHFPKGMFDDSMLDDMLDDSVLQDVFGGATEKEITVASDPDALKILALPVQGRPAGFSGAVGNFEVAGDLSADKTASGDPITLRLKITGTGSFDRVNSAMLPEGNGWKTYKPSSKFNPADSAGYGGEKVFEQAVIATQSGVQTIPPIAFSYFNPGTHRFETKHTASLTVTVAPASNTAPSAIVKAPAANTSAVPASVPPLDGLRADHVETGAAVQTLRPLYFQAWFAALQCAIIGAILGAWFMLSFREKRANDTQGARLRESSRAVAKCVAAMDAALNSRDSHAFFQAARSAFQQKLAVLWNSAPETITIAELDAHPGAFDPDVRRVFALADEAAYSGQGLTTADFQQWKQTVLQQLNQMEAR